MMIDNAAHDVTEDAPHNPASLTNARPRPATLPAAIDLAAFLRRMELAARGENWEVCHAAIDDLKREAKLARLDTWTYAERLRATSESIGVDVVIANRLARAGLHTVADLLYADRATMEGIRQVGDGAIEAIRLRLVAVLANTPDARAAQFWPRE